MPNKPSDSLVGIGIAVFFALGFAVNRAFSIKILPRDVSDNIPSRHTLNPDAKENNNLLTPRRTDALLVHKGTTNTTSRGISELQEQAIGYMAQTICSSRLHDYTIEQFDQKINFFIESKQAPPSLKEWMAEPRVANVAATLSMAFSPNCSNIDFNKDEAKSALRMMDEL